MRETFIGICLLVQLVGLSVSAEGVCNRSLAPSRTVDLPRTLRQLSDQFDLHSNHVGLVSQNSGFLRRNDTACGFVNVMNFIQTLRAAKTRPLLPDSVSLIDGWQRRHPQTAEGLSPSGIVKFLKYQMRKYLPDVGYSVDLKVLDFQLPAEMNKGVKLVSRIQKSDLETSSRQLQILGFVIVQDGKMTGSHVMTLVKRSKDMLDIIEPHSPDTIDRMELDPIRLNDSAVTLRANPLARDFTRKIFWATEAEELLEGIEYYLNMILTITLNK
jgi:hypothetical protein